MPLDEYLKLWSEHGIDEIDSLAKHAANALSTVQRRAARAQPPPPAVQSLDEIRAWLGDCQRCGLCTERNSIVFGEGSKAARLFFVGEGPGQEEDQEGKPFVGAAGQLLTKIIEAMGMRRSDVYIANIVKCRPPANRTPKPEEVSSCLPFLRAQIDLLQPRIVIALGLTAARALTQSDMTMTMGNLRGRFHSLFWNPNLPLMPTYHPAYLLRNPEAKKTVWEDMKQVKTRLELLH